MQELSADREFFDWLRDISADYSRAMSCWSQHVHDVAAAGDTAGEREGLLGATDAAIEQLVRALMAIGARHEDPHTSHGAMLVLDALDALLGASAELLREARAGVQRDGLPALAELAPRIADLRDKEAAVERVAGNLRSAVGDRLGDAGRPEDE